MKQILIHFSSILSVLCVVLFISLTISGCAGISPDIKKTDIGTQPEFMDDLIGFIDTEMKAKKNNRTFHSCC